MINEAWLCSSLKLCDLVTTSESAHSDDSAQVVINSDSYPQPAYNLSSIQHTLETYSHLLDVTLGQNLEPIQHFAQMTAKTIIDSAIRIRDPRESIKLRGDDVEMLAEELTLQVCCKALEEMEGHHYSDDPSSKSVDDKEGTYGNASALCSSGYPQPAYNLSSIQHTLETYSHLLDVTLGQNLEPIQHFAQMTAKTIIDSAIRIRDPRESIKLRGDDVEMLAEELTLQVCCKALEEMEGHHYSDDPSSKSVDDKEGTYGNASALCSSGYNCDKNTSEMETDNKMEEYDDTSTTVYATSLKSMASLGSIEYPDAPPSTPLLPEMIRSRDSFTRKLKGGLAKEFLPSPPPPTPKDHMQPLMENQMTDASADFMVRLMRSLSLECCQNGGLEEDENREVGDSGLQNDVPGLTDYAAQISADILHFITTNEIKVKDEGCVQSMWAITDQLASEIVTTSLAEVMARGEWKVLEEETTSCSKYKVDVAPDTKSKISATDGVKVLASELIINAMVHTFAKLGQGVYKHGTQPHLSGQTVEPQPWEEGRYSNTLCKDSINSHKVKPFRCCSDKSELNPITDDAIKVKSSVDTFANDFAEDVLQHSVCLLFNYKQSQGAGFGPEKDIKPWLIKMCAGESPVQELQCALLWAAASQKGTKALQFELPDKSLQQKLCRLSRSARLNGWTVGALMASLDEFCDMHQETSRGLHKSSDSLLEHLQHLIDNVRLNGS
ncbi:uncharacterized protein LOC107742319 [Sinocyclocheilus rhinocerous]|uniref:uncharacterized protein LOC107742319 n=1 Tax=Sinocyclocheilus rhinocerous TaxID=307959 RepID=UPI0007BA6312|nr:PREDICTED: uncharacterized protein LOC107742319 [Sinocyclocheilus rhinocerous]